MMANFEKSDHIVYDNAGVCFIEDITAKKFDYWDNERICYVLRPIGNPGSFVYVPVDNEKLTKKMRRIMSKEEIDTILDNVRTQYIIWPDDRRTRMERFKEILYAKNQQDMLMLASCIYTQKKELAACGKKNGLEAIHDPVHEMAREEARTSKALECMLKRYVNT